MSDEFNWDTAVSEWQSLEPDMPAIKTNMKWLSIRMKLILGLDVLSLLALFVMDYYVFAGEDSLSLKIWFSLVSVFAIVGVFFDFYLRRDLWVQPATTKEVFLHLIKRARVGIQIARFGVIYLSMFFFIIMGWGAYVAAYEAHRFEKSGALLSIILGGAAIVISILVCLWYGKRKTAELKDAEKIYQDFQQS